MKLMFDVNIRYVVQNILVYQYPRWRHDPSPYRSWIL